MSLKTDPKLTRPDDFYEALLSAHEGLSKEESDAFNARLILVLANHIGKFETLLEALEAAKESK
ncbi:DUF2783 domain-containing protein [Paracoccaceae bacterium GXU_MW_L88]